MVQAKSPQESYVNRLQEETSDAHLKLLCSIWVLRSGVFGVLCNHTWYVYYDVYNGPHFGSLSWAHVSNFYYFYFFPHKGWLEGSQWPNVCVNQATQETRWLFWKHAMYKWIGHIALVSFNSNMGDLTNFVLVLINMFHLILIHLIAYWW